MSKKKKKGLSSASSKIIDKANRSTQTMLGESIHNPPKSYGSNDKILAIIFFCVLLIVPLLIRAKIAYFVAPLIISSAVNTGIQGEVFTGYKWLAVMFLAIAATIVLADKIVMKRYTIRRSYVNVPLLVLVILVLASLLAAEYKSISLFGVCNQPGGAMIFLACLALFLAAANTAYRSWFVRGVYVALMIFTIINTALVLWSFSGHYLLQSDLVRSLVIPKNMQDIMQLQGTFETTMNHMNYISGFSAALFALFAGGAILQADWKKRGICIILALAAFTVVLGSLSSSGFVTIIIILPLILLIALRSLDKKSSLSVTGIILGSCMVIFVIMNSVNPKVYEETFKLFGIEEYVTGSELSSNGTAENMTMAKVDEAAFLIHGQAKESLQSKAVSRAGDEEQRTAVNQDRPNTIELSGELQLPEPGVTTGTGRLYIWKNTADLIMERPILGYGSGTLAYYFPQNDIYLIANLGSYNYIITKPHNMYLGIAFDYGIPALIILLILFGFHFIHTARHLWHSQLNGEKAFQTSLFMFFCAFLVQAIFNDVIVDTGAIFWLLFGIGAAFNPIEYGNRRFSWNSRI